MEVPAPLLQEDNIEERRRKKKKKERKKKENLCHPLLVEYFDANSSEQNDKYHLFWYFPMPSTQGLLWLISKIFFSL